MEENEMAPTNEARYTVAEIVSAADKVFEGKNTKALVLAGLRFGGFMKDTDTITISKAKELVTAFAERKVVS